MPLLLDACQSVGQLTVDVDELGCDILSATGRKFLRGPRGTGFLYVRRALLGRLEPPFLDLHAAEWNLDGGYTIRDDARRFENWETNFAGKVGLGVAADYSIATGIDATWERIQTLAARLRGLLGDVPGVEVADRGEVLGAIVTFTVRGRRAAEVRDALAANRVNVSTIDASSARLDLDRRGIPEVVRASVHHFNVDEELERLVEGVAELA